MIARLFLAAMLAVAAYPTKAAQPEQPSIYMGAGTSSCGAWTAARQNRLALAYEQWVLGYISGMGEGVNAVEGHPFHWDALKGTDAQGVWAWIDNYCRDHPTKDIRDAASTFSALSATGRLR